MDTKKIAHELQDHPIRVKGSPRPIARIIGWYHATNGTISIRDDQLHSPFIGVQYEHYRKFINQDHARMMDLIAPVHEALKTTTQRLQILGAPQFAAGGDNRIHALRASRSAARNQKQINELKVQKQELEAQLQNFEKIYQDRCGKAQGIVEARLYSYRCGASSKLFKRGLDVNVPNAALLPELPEQLLPANEKEE